MQPPRRPRTGPIPFAAAALLAAALAMACSASARGAVTLESLGAFDRPTYIASYPGDAERLLIAELGGRIQLVEGETRTPVLDLATPGLAATGVSSGIFSFALAPDFERTGHLFVAYARTGTDEEPELAFDLQVDRFTVDADAASLDSRVPLLTVPMADGMVHTGGQLQFGPDGMLFVSVGDGSPGTDALELAQSPEDLHGKILRIDPQESGSPPYVVPEDNPFAGPAPGRDEIWSMGLRNPWRFSFDRASGDLWIGDVGEGNWEEIDHAAFPALGRGSNYGWDCREGFEPYEPAGCAGTYVDPAFAYPHAPGGNSVTGGYVVRDPTLGALTGRFLYADAINGEIRSVDPYAPGGPDDRFEVQFGNPISFGEDACGRLYVTSLLGQVARIVGDGGDACEPPQEPPMATGPSATCASRAATVAGAVGTKAADVILGSPGRDRIRGRGGDDLICAGDGDDILRGGSGDDVLHGGRGADRCRGGGGKDRLRSC
jgi:glucose/arabinose dehydrogenase